MGKKILVADDEPEICEMIQVALSEKGYDVVSVEDGKKALDTLNKESFDLLILDVMMPQIDGYHLTYILKSRESGPIPKILIISSRDPDIDQHIGEKSGADGQITKPIEIKSLLSKIEELIGRP